ncbi:hypothetical protein R6Q59_006219 [Mikania micrantha]
MLMLPKLKILKRRLPHGYRVVTSKSESERRGLVSVLNSKTNGKNCGLVDEKPVKFNQRNGGSVGGNATPFCLLEAWIC